MSKLPPEHSFLDLSDYGRKPARWFALLLKNTTITPIHITLLFGVAGLTACYFILTHLLVLAGLFLILKSILDAADGELARVRSTPSYTGRYLDSIFDIILNFLIVMCIWHITDSSVLIALLAFVGIQLQGTLFNYYYVILRNEFDGDDTSRINEKRAPKALPGEKQLHVNMLYQTFNILYRLFDQAIYHADPKAPKKQEMPHWLMTLVSAMGLGFQLLIIAVMLSVQLERYILPFFVGYTLLIPVLIFIRRRINRQN
ncbi:CDP-alcohol phosphatidyltransferase family protein [Bacteroidia bacterium]|nr:CDP-alcohol phosphatidyltransferase family protein [Bacteroidia bacterium]